MPTVDYGPKIEREVERIEAASGLTEGDRKDLFEYKRDIELEGLSDSWTFELLVHTRKCAERLDRSLAEAKERDVKDIVAWVQNRNLAESTRSDYKKAIKRFFKWLNGGEYPDKVKWISTTCKKNNEKLPEKLLTEDDVQKLIDAARNPRNKALLSMMWETGARPGEYLDLEVGDIEDRENGKKVVIDGKTGPRRLPLVSSVPHLNAWLNQHPAGNPDAPLWCRLDDHPRERIDYDYFRKLLRQIADRAEVDKPMFPYQFRHSRATYLANHLTEAQMCEWFGWVQGSNRPATYVHLTGRDMDPTYDEMFGLTEKEDRKPKLAPEECPRCGEMNGKKTKFCSKCGLPLETGVAERLQRESDFADEVYDEGVQVEGGIEELVDKLVRKKLKEVLEDGESLKA